AAAGEVTFAGAVAGSLFVTVDHGGGLRSTYGFVRAVLVTEGDPVRAGTPVAVAGGPFHFGVRLNGEYVDPAGLFGARVVRVRLVPHDHDDTQPAPGRRRAAAGSGDRVAALEWARHAMALDAGTALRHWQAMAGAALREWGAAVAGRIPVVWPAPPATLLDGPNGPRTMSGRRRRTHFTRASPGRLGVRHGCATGKRKISGSHHHEAAAGGRGPLRPPDPPVEPEDEAVHLRRAERDPHRGSPPDPPAPRGVLHLRA
ncbi:MAG: M23 family metallopeptidase, partial [Actinobacteria bacterium]|nr:M23 family metallopeptidase [Actinomycetota bacterium]NIS29598.1 M23 family metallopeptidase [Actinomycetota bacterium]NIT94628.1 M23 family metallopeptidase [Actinomycetota bacterium]NIU18236.1 M23 family metallopeptidase [Actinomycetota bacterium]NIU64930.1 M23 family metallopeptidase [Actinomycetota bacterium]